ncbi:5'-nucleotidase domain-containing protein 1-like isoform X2 [Rhopilema esculentum]|uniref:5'-nucleotidase domain-containing protein 1-like isoform X2 n=1 Tax=Rhopilema esculentum TaxID=499914 RepID=UPI0031CF1AC2
MAAKVEPQENGSGSENSFCLEDYDCFGFDMDHTVVQYHLEAVFKLIYGSFAQYLIEKKGYDKHLLDEKYSRLEDFSLRGLTFEIKTGNFVKLRQDGYIIRACHGMTVMSDSEIEACYGKERIWKYFKDLKSKVHHGVYYKCFENFFDMPIGVLCARIVDIIDETQGRPQTYTFWPDIFDTLMNSFGPKCFSEHRGYFFSAIKENAKKYIKKCPDDVIRWFKDLRKAGKILFLVTQSYIEYTRFLMEWALGKDWLDLFDLVVTDAKKPDFFFAKPEERPFKIADGENEGTICKSLERHHCYSQGTAISLENTVKRLLNKDNLKIVFFGDSPKSDMYPPFKYRGWDTVGILEEMEAEEVHFQKHSSCYQAEIPAKRQKVTMHLAKEEKIIVASKQWGSFFRDDKQDENDASNCHEAIVNTFWADVIRSHCKLAIPLLDYITGDPITEEF